MSKNFKDVDNGTKLVLYIYEHYHEVLLASIEGMLKEFNHDSTLVDDLMSDFYLKMCSKWKTVLDGIGENELAYFKKTMRNMLYTMGRKEKNTKNRNTAYSNGKRKDAGIYHMCVNLYVTKMLEIIKPVLSKDEFEVMSLIIIEYKPREVAQYLGISSQKVYNLTHSARKKLAKFLDYKNWPPKDF